MANADPLRARLRSAAQTAVTRAAPRAVDAARRHTPVFRTWDWGDDPRDPFPWHLSLDRCSHAGGDDPALATAGTPAVFVGPHFHVGDHRGCRCRTVPTPVETRPVGPFALVATLDPQGASGPTGGLAVQQGRTVTVVASKAGVTERAAGEFSRLLSTGWAEWLRQGWAP